MSILKFTKRRLNIEINEFFKRYWVNSIKINKIIIYDMAGEIRYGLSLNEISSELLNDFKYDKDNSSIILFVDI